jgi:transporter family protein
MQWLILALLSAISAALVAIFGKIGLEGVDTTLATGLRAGVMFVFMTLVLLFTKKIPDIMTLNRKAVFYIILGGIAGALSWIFYFLALKLGQASKVAPIDRLSVVFVIIFAALFLGEKLTLKVAIGTLLIVVGAILIALK